MSEKQSPTVVARLDIEIFVDCPECGVVIDLMNKEHTSGIWHNEDGDLLSQACPSNVHWTDAHEKFSVKPVTCTVCETIFNVERLEW